MLNGWSSRLNPTMFWISSFAAVSPLYTMTMIPRDGDMNIYTTEVWGCFSKLFIFQLLFCTNETVGLENDWGNGREYLMIDSRKHPDTLDFTFHPSFSFERLARRDLFFLPRFMVQELFGSPCGAALLCWVVFFFAIHSPTVHDVRS